MAARRKHLIFSTPTLFVSSNNQCGNAAAYVSRRNENALRTPKSNPTLPFGEPRYTQQRFAREKIKHTIDDVSAVTRVRHRPIAITYDNVFRQTAFNQVRAVRHR